jgi:hypothetical protein
VITAREIWLVFVVVERIGAGILYFNEQSANYGSKYKRVQEMKARKAGGKGQKWQIILPALIIRQYMVIKK